MNIPFGRVMLVEEDIPLHREHPHRALEDRAGLGEGAEGLDQARLDPFQKVQNGRDAVHVHMVDKLDQGGVDRGGE